MSTINGGNHADLLIGTGNADIIHGGNGTDLILGGNGADQLFGDNANDIVSGGSGNDAVEGGNGTDLLSGDDGDDDLDGGNGSDILAGGEGDDSLDGGSGLDTSVYLRELSAYRFTLLADGSIRVTDLHTGDADTVRNVELFVFTDAIRTTQNLPFTIVTTPNNQGGVDIALNDAAALDAALGTAGIDNVTYGGTGDIALPHNIENVTLTGAADIDATGNDADNRLIGNAGDNRLNAGAGDDFVDGGAGDDTLVGGSGAGNDTYVGGAGIDTVVYSSASQGIVVDLTAGTATGPEIGNDTLSGIENVVGGAGDDVITGDAAANTLSGDGGNDVLDGRGGDDILDGGSGTDLAVYSTATGGISVDLAAGTASGAGVGSDTLISIERIRGSSFGDTFVATGFAGASVPAGTPIAFNEFEGMGGNDVVTGNGVTRISYLSATAAVTVDLAAGTATGNASVGSDQVTGIRFVRGSDFGDTLFGSDNASGFQETFEGRGGNDVIDGRGGTDRANYNSDAVASGISVNLGAGTVTGDAAVGTDTLRSVESVRGTRLADVYDASTFALPGALNVGSNGTFNEFEGEGGDDVVTGNGSTRIGYLQALAGVTVDIAAGTGGGTAPGDVAGVGSDSFSGVNAIRGSTFDDALFGSDNAPQTTELFEGFAGDDHIEGRGGFDVARYDNTVDPLAGPLGITVNLAAGTVTGRDAAATAVFGTDTLRNVEAVRGSDAGDLFDATGFTGTGAAIPSPNAGSIGNLNEFEGMGGDDVVTGNGNTRISYLNASAGVIVNLGSGVADGAATGHDTFTGVNAVRGSQFDDEILGSAGDDDIDGRGGFDVVRYDAPIDELIGPLGIDVDLAAGVVTGRDAAAVAVFGTDTVHNVEAVRGSTAADLYDATGFTGAGAPIPSQNAGSLGSFNQFEGMGGDDVVAGNGNTRISYLHAAARVIVNLGTGVADGAASGHDVFSGVNAARGSQFDDELRGSAGPDNLDGQGGNDFIGGGPGNDTLTGGAGFDTVAYANAAAAVTVDIGAAALATGGAGTDALGGFEAIIGSAFADTLLGSNGDNSLTGNDGNDVLAGRLGNDTLSGGTGIDVARFTGSRNAYAITGTSSVTVSGPDGTDSLTGVELLEFGDSYFLTGSMPTIDLSGFTLIAGHDIFAGAIDNALSLGLNASSRPINLGAGDDTLTLTASGNPLYLLDITGVEHVISVAASDTVVLQNAATGVEIDLGTGTDTLNLASGTNVVTARGIETISGGTGNDTVTFFAQAGVTGQTINLFGGTNVINLGTSGPYVLSVLGTNLTVSGTGASNTLTLANLQNGTTIDLGSGSADTLNLTAAGGDNTVRVRNVETVNGGSAHDTVTLLTAVSGITVSLGAGLDTLNLANGNNDLNVTRVEELNGGTGNDRIELRIAAGASHMIRLGAGDDTLELIDTGVDADVTVNSVETIDGSAAAEHVTIVADSGVTSVTGDYDLSGDYDVVTLAAGSVSYSLALSDVEEINTAPLGGLEALTLENAADGLIINLGFGTDVLNLANDDNVATVIDVEAIDGGSSEDWIHLVGTGPLAASIDLGSDFDVVDLAPTGFVFTLALHDVEWVTGGASGDLVVVSNSQSGTQFNLGTGYDVLTLAAAGNDVTTSNVEEVHGGLGNDTLTFFAESGRTHQVIDLAGGNQNVVNLAGGGSHTLALFGNQLLVNGSGGQDDLTVTSGQPGNNLGAGTTFNLGGGFDILTLADAPLNAITAIGVEQLNGGFGDEIITFIADSTTTYAINLGTGRNELNLVGTGTRIELSGTGLDVNGTGGSDEIYLLTGQFNSSFHLHGGADALFLHDGVPNLVTIDSVESVVGSSMSDEVVIEADPSMTSIVGDFDLRDSFDVLRLNAGGAVHYDLTLSGVEAIRVGAADGDETVTLVDAAQGLEVSLGAGPDTLNLADAQNDVVTINVDRVNGGFGDDTVHLTDQAINSVTVHDVETVWGHIGNDHVTILRDGFSVSGHYYLLFGQDTLTLGTAGGEYILDLDSVETVNTGDLFSGDERVVLQNNAMSMRVDLGGGDDTLELAGSTNEMRAVSVEHLVGGTGDDFIRFVADPDRVGQTIELGEGENTVILEGNQHVLELEVSGSNLTIVGAVAGNAGNETLTLLNEQIDTTIDLAGGTDDRLNLADAENEVHISGVEYVDGGDMYDVIFFASPVSSDVTVSDVEEVIGQETFDVVRVADTSDPDVMVSVFNVDHVFGSAHADDIEIVGNIGRTTVTGGLGADIMWASLDSDWFRYVSTADSPVGEGRDHIFDFDTIQDRVDLRGFGATGVEIVTEGDLTLLRVSVDGDFVPEMEIGFFDIVGGPLTTANLLF